LSGKANGNKTGIIPEKYWFNEQMEYLLTSNTINSEETVLQLIYFLFNSFFQSFEPVPEVYRDDYKYVLNLSSFRERLIDFDYLERFYPKWIEETGRTNTMDEYGMLLDFIGYAKKGMDKKYLLMVVSNRPQLVSKTELLLLKVIWGMPSHWSIYHLTRFFAKTDIAVTFYEDLRNLVSKQMISPLDAQAQVEIYRVTEDGQKLLKDRYNINDIKDYVMEIEPTGFVLDILYKMDSND
jgi:DNA-binding PadR family transcriptional regulator